MAIYSLGIATVAAAAAAPYQEVRTAAADRAAVLEIGSFNNAATSSAIGFGRPAAIGITPTSPITFLAEDSGAPAGTVTTATAWGTAPTAPTNFARRAQLGATIGLGIIWTFPRGYIIPVSSSVVLWNFGGAGAGVQQTYFVEDE